MLRVLHTGGANQERVDLHHQRCKSRCNLPLNLHKSDARECLNQESERVALGDGVETSEHWHSQSQMSGRNTVCSASLYMDLQELEVKGGKDLGNSSFVERVRQNHSFIYSQGIFSEIRRIQL